MNFRSPMRGRNQHGYILLTLMLFVALLTIGLLALVQNIESQIKRDREEELIHRGVQYSRAVRHYFKKFGRYPNSIEDLENTNNYRSLRKRYKDPITGKDFKLLHMTDVQLAFSTGLPPGVGPNGTTAGNLNTPAPGASGQDPTASQDPQPGDQSGTPDQTNQPTPGVAAAPSAGQQPGFATGSNQPTFGGGAVVGVASTSRDKTIREFNNKDHYNQWQFIYDPTSDRGGLLMTPNQPPLRGSVQSVEPGANGAQPPPGQNPNLGQGQPGTGNAPQPPSQ